MNEEKNQRGLTRRQFLCGAGALLAVMVLAVAGLGNGKANQTSEPEASQVDNHRQDVVDPKCQLVQTLHYTPCGHEMTRRQTVPQELVGKTRQEAEALYDQWRITGFSAGQIDMTRQLDIHCAQHLVLKPDEAGVLAVFENKYGDALAFVRSLDIPLSALPTSYQEEVRPGKGFDSLQMLEQWLESVES